MKFTNTAKGQLTQSIAKMLFERAGYRVTRLGIEELFHEVIHLDAAQYKKLGLPEPLRFLPDLLVATPEISAARLVEVKFRSRFNETSSKDLYSTLSRQFEYWPHTVCMLMIAEPLGGNRFHQDFIRTVDRGNLDYLMSNRWSRPWSPESGEDPVQHTISSAFKVSGAEGIWNLLT